MRITNCFRITATDSTIVRLTEFPGGLTMSNDTVYYNADHVSITERNDKITNTPIIVDIGSVIEASTLGLDEIYSRKWDGAVVRWFTTDWSNPVEDETPISLFYLSKVRVEDGRFIAELLGVKDKLNTVIGDICQPLCTKVFTDEHIDGETIIAKENWQCKLEAATYTVSETITTVTNDYTFEVSGLDDPLYPDDWFGNGELLFTSGAANYGLGRRKVESFTQTNGVVVLDSPLYYTPEVGDPFDIKAGCRKRWSEDCVTKFDNGVNHGGFPHVPNSSQILDRGIK